MTTQSKYRILFLDVDGVLNSYKTGGRYSLKRNCLRRLQKIIDETQCKIVLSSTWRMDEYALKRLRRVLSYRDIKIFDTTPVLGKYRGLEIAVWLDTHKDEISKYAILDDDSSMEEWQLPNFFQTDPEYGMTDTITYRIIYHLTNV